jgi:DNA-binding transcriptional LysR family regulator
MISAAIAGQGIALGRPQLLGSMLSDGRLRVLKVLRAGPVTSHAYWLIKARSNPRPDVLTAARWIKSQAEAVEKQAGGGASIHHARTTDIARLGLET